MSWIYDNNFRIYSMSKSVYIEVSVSVYTYRRIRYFNKSFVKTISAPFVHTYFSFFIKRTSSAQWIAWLSVSTQKSNWFKRKLWFKKILAAILKKIISWYKYLTDMCSVELFVKLSKGQLGKSQTLLTYNNLIQLAAFLKKMAAILKIEVANGLLSKSRLYANFCVFVSI